MDGWTKQNADGQDVAECQNHWYVLRMEAEVYCPSLIMFNWRRPILTSFINLLKSKEAEMNFLMLWDAVNSSPPAVNSSPPGQNGRYFTDHVFRCIFLNEKFCILIKISLKFVPKGPINNSPALVEIIAWYRIGDKPLFEPMLTRFTDTCMWH